MEVTPSETPASTAPSLLDVVYETLLLYVMPVFFLIGVLGNALSVLIFTRRHNNDRASATYLRILSLVDLVNLSLGIQISVFGAGLMSGMATSHLGCQVRMYVHWVAVHLSSWVLIVFTIERSLVIMFPLRMKTAFDSGKGRRLALGLLIGTTVPMYMYYPFDVAFVTLPDGTFHCLPAKNMSKILSFFADFAEIGLCYLAPMCIIPIGNLIILRGMKLNRCQENNETRRQNLRMLRNLFVVTCAQFIANGPQTGVLIYRTILGGQAYAEYQLKILYTTALIVRISYCINPCLYIFSLDYYRSEILRILLPCVYRRAEKGAVKN